jgi:hypothetical protein
MSLKFVHQIIIFAGISIALIFAWFCFTEPSVSGNALYLAAGIGSIGAAIGLGGYEVHFLKKTRSSFSEFMKKILPRTVSVLTMLFGLISSHNAVACAACYGDTSGSKMGNLRHGHHYVRYAGSDCGFRLASRLPGEAPVARLRGIVEGRRTSNRTGTVLMKLALSRPDERQPLLKFCHRNW